METGTVLSDPTAKKAIPILPRQAFEHVICRDPPVGKTTGARKTIAPRSRRTETRRRHVVCEGLECKAAKNMCNRWLAIGGVAFAACGLALPAASGSRRETVALTISDANPGKDPQEASCATSAISPRLELVGCARAPRGRAANAAGSICMLVFAADPERES